MSGLAMASGTSGGPESPSSWYSMFELQSRL
jgi:hypothetical protein